VFERLTFRIADNILSLDAAPGLDAPGTSYYRVMADNARVVVARPLERGMETHGRPTEEDSDMAHERKGRGRGFASMDPQKQREIASKGGRAAHMQGTAHEWSSEEAREAGRKGGAASRNSRRDQE
jgi:uncharacterized protein